MLSPEGSEMFFANQLKKETDQQLVMMMNRINLLKRNEQMIKEKYDRKLSFVRQMDKQRQEIEREKQVITMRLRDNSCLDNSHKR